MIVSIAASCGWMPTAIAWASAISSWSVASISASSLIVSTAGPLRRSASERSAVSPPTDFACSVREMESGLYCSVITRRIVPEAGSASTRPPLSNLGDLGKVEVMALPCGEGGLFASKRRSFADVLCENLVNPELSLERYPLAPAEAGIRIDQRVRRFLRGARLEQDSPFDVDRLHPFGGAHQQELAALGAQEVERLAAD